MLFSEIGSIYTVSQSQKVFI